MNNLFILIKYREGGWELDFVRDSQGKPKYWAGRSGAYRWLKRNADGAFLYSMIRLKKEAHEEWGRGED